jgi:hypothetical protein
VSFWNSFFDDLKSGHNKTIDEDLAEFERQERQHDAKHPFIKMS